MSQRIKYKVISFSSEEKEYPASSFLVPGSDGWQTKRFCTYPQEVTFEFYGVVRVEKIEMMADTRKIASSVDVLYYDPTQSATESRFVKYGSLEFSRNESGRIHEQKTVMVDLKCLYIRFLFHRPFKNKENFFSQVHIHQLSIYGGESNIALPLDHSIGKKVHINPKAISEQEDEFVYQKLLEIQSMKDQAVAEQNFDDAERLKQIMLNVKKFGYYLKGLKHKKQEAAENEDFEEAKNIKEQIDRVRRQVEALVNSGLNAEEDEGEGMELSHDVQDNEFVGMEMNQLLERQSNSRVSHQGSRVKESRYTRRDRVIDNSYDQRVIPTLQNKLKTDESQVLPPNEQEVDLPEAEEIEGNNASDAILMQQFFDEETVKRFYSKKWQLKDKALTSIIEEAKKKPQDTPLIKCLVKACSHSIKETNFKLAISSIALVSETLKINSSVHKANRSNADIQRELQEILDEIIRKMSDNNSKIRSTAESTFQQMIDSSLFGVDVCSSALMKPTKVKLSVKQEAQRLNSLLVLVTRYGLGDHGVPNNVIDYGVDKLSNPAGEVRSEAIGLLAVCSSHNEKDVASRLEGKKPIYLQQVEERKRELGNKSNLGEKGGKKK